MKKVWNSFLISFAMFSKIPVPRADWDKENMKYMMCFFPAIGVVIGLLEWGYGWVAMKLEFGSLMRAAGFVLILLYSCCTCPFVWILCAFFPGGFSL